MNKQTNQNKPLLFSLLKPNVIILILSLLHFLSISIYVWRGIKWGQPGTDEELFLIRPIILLVAAFGLWHGKLWSYILSFCLSAWFVYVLANSDFPFASEISKTLFSINVFAAFWRNEYVEHSQTPFQLFMFAIIACCCIISMLHLSFCHLKEQRLKLK